MDNIKTEEDLIYDVGMHTGKDTEFYLKKGFRVVAVEANPALVEKAKQKFAKEIQAKQLIIVDKAISEQQGKIKFYINETKDDWGSIVAGWNTSMHDTIKEISVESIPFETIIRKYGLPYYMKIDIEGADIICLKSLYKLGVKPKYISCELLAPHNLNTQNIDSLDILCHLKTLGYTHFFPSDQSRNNSIVCPKPAKEGKYIDYKFDGETSGLFGKELTDKWYSFDYFVYNYLQYFHEYNGLNKIDYLIRVLNKYLKTKIKQRSIFPKYSWIDVHATIV